MNCSLLHSMFPLVDTYEQKKLLIYNVYTYIFQEEMNFYYEKYILDTYTQYVKATENFKNALRSSSIT